MVSEIQAVGLGLARLVVDSTDGSQTAVQSTLFTGVLVPGKVSATVADIRLGDSLAATGTVRDGVLGAESIMVIPPSPVSHAHMAAALVGISQTGAAQLMDAHGNLVTVDVSPRVGAMLQPAGVVIGALRQDLKTGSLVLSGAEGAEDAIDRLTRALGESSDRGGQENAVRLGRRLQRAVTGSLTTSRELIFRVDPTVRFIFQQAFNTRLEALTQVLSESGLTPALVRGEGVVQRTSAADDTVVIAPEAGPDFDPESTCGYRTDRLRGARCSG